MKISDECKLLFNNEELPKLEPSINIPLMIEFKPIKCKKDIQQSNMTIELNSLNINKIREHQYNPIQINKTNLDILKPSIWTILIYGCTLTLILVLLSRRYEIFKFLGFSKRQPENTTTSRNPTQAPPVVPF